MHRRSRAALAAVLLAAGMGLGACGPHDPRAKSVLALAGDPARGRALYDRTCAGCHASSAAAWRWTRRFYGDEGVVSTMIEGVPHTKMPSFAGWNDQQLADVNAYVRAVGK